MALPKTQNPSRTDYSADFYRERPPASDDDRHLWLIVEQHLGGFPFWPADRIEACGL